MSAVAKAVSGNRRPFILRKGISRLSDLADYVGSPVDDIFLDTFSGSDANDGKSWASAVNTMSRALALVETGGRVFFRGKVAEQLTGSNLKFDISIIGVGSLHHADQPGSGSSLYHYGAASWVTAGTATTPLITVRGRGWNFVNIMFDAPADDSAVLLSRNALSGTSEYDASHASFINCDFRNGLRGIEDEGGCFNVLIENCVFETFDATTSGAAIINTSTSVASPRRWRIVNCFFQPDSSTEGNERHIVSPLNGSLITKSVFGTVKGTGKYIDLTGGTGNVVFDNLLMGAYDTGDYVGGTGDSWAGNQSLSASFGGNDAQGRTLTAPASAT